MCLSLMCGPPRMLVLGKMKRMVEDKRVLKLSADISRKRVWMRCACMVLVFVFISCHHKTEHHGKTPLMQVGSKFLYEEDLRQVLPYGLSGADSVAFVRDYMRKWAEDQVLYEKAELNIRGSERIEQMVNDYRRALIMNSYEQLLIGEKMSEELSEEDLRQYYEENKQLFMLEEPVIKGVFIKAPLSAPGLKDLKRWYKDNASESLEQLEKYAFRNAVIYEYFYDHWLPVSELEGKLVVNLSELSEDFDKHRNVEYEDESHCYLLHIEEYIVKGEVKPYDLARHEIVDLLASKRKVDFMNEVKEDLYNQSLEMGRIKTFSNEEVQSMGDAVRHVDDNAGNGAE